MLATRRNRGWAPPRPSYYGIRYRKSAATGLSRLRCCPAADTHEVLEWDDLTPYQQWMVEEGRKTAIEMPDTVQNGEQWMEWFRSLRKPPGGIEVTPELVISAITDTADSLEVTDKTTPDDVHKWLWSE